MLTFLHTGQAHVETFDRLARELDDSVPVRHEVQAALLEQAVAAGVATAGVQLAVAETVRALASDGPAIILCTCSTIGGLAETVPVPRHVTVLRIDRAMAEQAVASGRRILLLAALQSTFEPTLALLEQIAFDANRVIEVVEVFCEFAWPFFERGDLSGYAAEIAKAIEGVARPSDLVLLAQASMAPAADLVAHLGVPVLSSPKPGLEAALALYRQRVRD